MSISRERLSSSESRAAALEAARELLIEEGPQAVTLKAVAAKVGKTHANLLHHFGSAAGLQAALAQEIGARVVAGIADAVERARAGAASPREIVDRVYDAFGQEGGGALAAWMILSGNRNALDPILTAVRSMVDQFVPGHEQHQVPETTLWLVLSALGDSLLGGAIAQTLDLPRDASRTLAAEAIQARLEAHHSANGLPPD
ncbi:MAG TPA: TetR family transcriptional regulator [Allosphingosinicella sp.]|uniref:TetR family transcriptional regulator n=1 Tax=Allosphingosinicella sp. TaxID=2823234 RepID=UPI002ED89EA8